MNKNKRFALKLLLMVGAIALLFIGVKKLNIHIDLRQAEKPVSVQLGKESTIENSKQKGHAVMTFAQGKERKGDILIIHNKETNHQTFLHDHNHYIELTLFERYFDENVVTIPFLEAVIISTKTNTFTLPVKSTDSEEEAPFSFQSDKNETQAKYDAISMNGRIYVPLDFIENELTYIVHEEEDKVRIVSAKEQEIEFPLDVPLVNQMDDPQLYNGCEVSSLAMLLQYKDIEVTKNELAEQIPTVPLVYEDGLKGNPNQGFVGDMANGPGLSVYHKPITELAQKYVGDEAIDITGSEPEVIYDYLDSGFPVWVITTTSLAPVDDFETWETPIGEIDVTFQVHSVAVTGYNEEYVYVNDPYGMKNRLVDRESFEAAWKQMGSQAIVITD